MLMSRGHTFWTFPYLKYRLWLNHFNQATADQNGKKVGTGGKQL
jgi:hypothetical protein